MVHYRLLLKRNAGVNRGDTTRQGIASQLLREDLRVFMIDILGNNQLPEHWFPEIIPRHGIMDDHDQVAWPSPEEIEALEEDRRLNPDQSTISDWAWTWYRILFDTNPDRAVRQYGMYLNLANWWDEHGPTGGNQEIWSLEHVLRLRRLFRQRPERERDQIEYLITELLYRDQKEGFKGVLYLIPYILHPISTIRRHQAIRLDLCPELPEDNLEHLP